jgi:O-antigen/teichoic acid export membrane protein
VRTLGVVALLSFEITLSRWLGLAGYGTFSFVAAVSAMISRLAPLGWLNASTRLISGYMTEMRMDLLKGSLIMSHLVSGVGLTVTGLAFIVVLVGFRIDFGSPLIWFAFPLAIALTLLELHRFVLRGLHAGDLGETFPVLLLPATVVLLVVSFGINTPGPALYVYGAAGLSMVVASGLCIWRLLPANVRTTAAVFRGRTWSTLAFAILIGSLSDEIVARIAVITLGSLGSESALGLYQAAARLSLMNLFVLRAITPVAGPRISALYHAGRIAELRTAYGRICLLSLAGCLPFFFGFTVFPEFFLGWFGPEFVDGAQALRILSLGYVVSAAAGPCATALMMIGKEKAYGVVAAFSAVFVIVVSLILIPLVGAIGAALATGGGIMGANIVYLVILRRALCGLDRPVRPNAPDDCNKTCV